MPSGSVNWFYPTGGPGLIPPDDGYAGVLVERAFAHAALDGPRHDGKRAATNPWLTDARCRGRPGPGGNKDEGASPSGGQP